MKPGEVITKKGDIIINEKSKSLKLKISNKGDRPIQVGSHYHFAETNEYLEFDRKLSNGKRLNIPSGTAIRFEPGQIREIELIDIQGERKIFGFNKKVMGSIE
ncbi:MAG: urease subunit beta [SAR116 cluster bacterium]|nr:urease subunit beta [SAR116 cluster bacterium]|tara:strand:+ start:4019 stop:4327 length:309 start_codon:yes stop_codon:yes gene_type:complete